MFRGIRETEDIRVLRDTRDIEVTKEPKETKDIWVCRVIKGLRVIKDIKVIEDIKGSRKTRVLAACVASVWMPMTRTGSSASFQVMNSLVIPTS